MTRLAAIFFLLLFNSAYLAAFASPSLFYFSNIVLHIALGIGLTIAAGVGRGFRPVLTKTPPDPFFDLRHLFMWVLLAAAAVSGAGLMVAGATTQNAWLLRGHIITSLAGSALLL